MLIDDIQSRQPGGRRLIAAALLAVIVSSALGAAPALAASPQQEPNPYEPTALANGPDVLTPQEQQIVAAKLASAKADQKAVEAAVKQGKLAPASCPFVVGRSPGSVSPDTGCGSYWGYVSTYARQQQYSYWCGPAAVQVVSNYTWGYGSSGNKYDQGTIATYAGTTTSGTLVGNEAAAARHFSILPPGFTYTAQQASDGSQWHSWLRQDVNAYAMPQIAGVAPHDPTAAYWLFSWPNPSNGPAGHYIVINGWTSAWDGTRNPTVNYNDGSAGFGGSTGAFIDPAYDMWYVIARANPNHAPRWVVW